MKQKDIKELKELIWIKNNKKCPILKKEFPLDKMVLDHAHKLKLDEYNEGKGTIRVSLHFLSNSFAGKIENAFRRYGLNKEYYLPDILRNIADYLEEGDYIDEDGYRYIHPKEVHKEALLSKKNYNKCKKLYNLDIKKSNRKRAKFPEYPKSKKVSVKLRELFLKYNIELYN